MKNSRIKTIEIPNVIVSGKIKNMSGHSNTFNFLSRTSDERFELTEYCEILAGVQHATLNTIDTIFSFELPEGVEAIVECGHSAKKVTKVFFKIKTMHNGSGGNTFKLFLLSKTEPVIKKMIKENQL
jgi:hypothetical protein